MRQPPRPLAPGIYSPIIILLAILLGFLAGRWSTECLHVSTVRAQDSLNRPPEDVMKKIVTAYEALKAAADALKNDNRYTPATKTINPYAVFVGGLNALDDLESGQGVDPLTFAGLYAGDAIDEILPHLSKDEEGRLTYKNRVVRLYPISRLKRLEQQRKELLGEAKRSDRL